MRTRRVAKNLSQAALAARLGTRQAIISDWERGQYPIDRRTELALMAIEADLDLTPEAQAA